MRFKISEPALMGFTGDFGEIEFVDGISTDNLSSRQIDRLAAIVRGFGVDSGGEEKQVGVAHRIVANRDDLAPVATILSAETNATELAPATKQYTHASLSEVADSGGISALRKIATDFNVKGKSIPELISLILAAQG